jgi:hypothetical protein
MDRAKYQITAPPEEKKGADMQESDKYSTERKNFRKEGKTPGGRSGRGKVKTAKRSTYKKGYGRC